MSAFGQNPGNTSLCSLISQGWNGYFYCTCFFHTLTMYFLNNEIIEFAFEA
jgi:hypothetical protein